MKTYDIEVRRLKSMQHDKGLIEIAIDASNVAHVGADGKPTRKAPQR